MSTFAVAKKDFRDAIRSRGLWGLTVLFFLLVVGVAVAYTQLDSLAGGAASAEGLIFFVASSVGTYVALAALLACFKSIVGERDTGTVKVLLSLPHSRRDVVLGKLLGRSAVLAIPVVATFVAGVAIGGALMGELAPTATAALAGISILFAVTYASIYVGISAMSGSDTRVTLLAVGFFVVFEFLWGIVSLILLVVSNGFEMPTGDFPAWYFLVNQIPPSSAFVTSLEAVIPDAGGQAMEGAGGAAASAGQFDAFFATPWIGLVILALWAVVPLLIGYRRFTRADL